MSKQKVVLIEDDEFLVNMYDTKLNEEGFEVVSALDGETGERTIKNEAPDVILLDILLPKKDGFEVLKSIREDSKTKDIPVILLTNLGQKEDVDKGLKLGANDYLIKAHFTPTEVVSKIRELLK